jgi:hypothetical protein
VTAAAAGRTLAAMTRTATTTTTLRRGAALGLALMLAAAGSAAAADAPFTSAPDITFPGPRTPLIPAIATGDLNSDGKQDLAIADFGGDRVLVRLGNGDGSYEPGGEVTGLSRPQDLVVADFTGDGTEDVAVAAGTSPDRGVALLRGLGNGELTFHTAFTLPHQGFANSMAAADFNNDGREDLVTSAFASVSVHLGTANGAFVTQPELTFGESFPGVVTTGDFDGDANEDLAVELTGGGVPPRLAVIPGKGDGAFGTPKPTDLPNGELKHAVGDLDGDGRADVLVPIWAEDKVSVRLGEDDGSLSDDAQDVPVGDRPVAVAIADFDGDGREDFAVAETDGDSVSVRLGQGDGSFRDGGRLKVGDFPYSLVAGDADGDGRADLAVANHSAGTISVRLGAGEAPLAGNLLVNGGFEQGLGARLPTQSPAVPGWETTGGMTFVRYGATPHLGFPSWLDAPRFGTGGMNFLWGGDSTGLHGITTAAQTADVSGTATAIDAGRARAELSAYLGGGKAYPDDMRVGADFLTAAGAPNGSIRIGPVSAQDRHNRTTLLKRSRSQPVPVGTRGIRVTLVSTDNDTVSSAIADNVKLTLDVAPAPAPPSGGGGTPGGGSPGGGEAPAPTRFGAATRVTLAAPHMRGGKVTVRVANANGFAVAGKLAGRTRGGKAVRLKGKRFRVAAGGQADVALKAPRTLRRRLRGGHAVRLRLSAAVADPTGTRRTVVRTARLRGR